MKKHIMLIDDDQDEMAIFLDALKQVRVEDGFKCTYADNATHAIIMLRYLIPDFIFVDLRMPGLDGIDFLSRIRTEERLKSVKIYIYSNTITNEVRHQAASLNADGCVTKVNNEAELVKKLEKVFSEFLLIAPGRSNRYPY